MTANFSNTKSSIGMNSSVHG